MVEAFCGLTILALLYYLSWTYLAKWLCRLLLKGEVTFVGATIKVNSCKQNGKRVSNSSDHEMDTWKTEVVAVPGKAHHGDCGPLFVTDGMLAEISQL